ncbi:hypothetical protein SLE2022_208620 [Rubroshorea leprosula]
MFGKLQDTVSCNLGWEINRAKHIAEIRKYKYNGTLNSVATSKASVPNISIIRAVTVSSLLTNDSNTLRIEARDSLIARKICASRGIVSLKRTGGRRTVSIPSGSFSRRDTSAWAGGLIVGMIIVTVKS